MKFYRHLNSEIEDFFSVKNKGFNYNTRVWEIPVSQTLKKKIKVRDGKKAIFFFVVKDKGEIIRAGPYLKDKKHVEKFKRKHKNTFSKKGRIHVKKKIDFTLKDFVNTWKTKNRKKLREMDITGLKAL